MKPDQVSLFVEQEEQEAAEERERLEYEAEQWGRGLWADAYDPPLPGPGCFPSTERRRRPGTGWLGDKTFIFEHRGVCLGCRWVGAVTDNENVCVAEAHDHAWPGWRDLPEQRRHPRYWEGGKKVAAFNEREAARLAPLYPPGWVERGWAPAVEHRAPPSSRHVPRGSVFGGYAMAVWEGGDAE